MSILFLGGGYCRCGHNILIVFLKSFRLIRKCSDQECRRKISVFVMNFFPTRHYSDDITGIVRRRKYKLQ